MLPAIVPHNKSHPLVYMFLKQRMPAYRIMIVGGGVKFMMCNFSSPFHDSVQAAAILLGAPLYSHLPLEPLVELFREMEFAVLGIFSEPNNH